MGFIALTFTAKGQIPGAPFIENYNARDYNASVSNFDIAQDAHGRMYFANWSGVLRFDGAEWRKISIDNGKSAYEIDIDSNDILHVSSMSDFGYLSIDSMGREIYNSVTPEIDMGEILEVVSCLDKTYYLTEKHLFQYTQNMPLKRVANDGNIVYSGNFHANGENAFEFDHKLYINIKDIGLTVLKDERLESILNGSILKNEMIISSANIGGQQLILMSSGKTFKFADNTITPIDLIPEKVKNEIIAFGPKCLGAKMTNGSLSVVFGTFKNGLYYIRDGEVMFHLNQKNGLANNEVRDVMFAGSNLWVSTQNGISKLTGLESFRFWETENQDIGLIWEIYKHNGQLYLATTKGPYAKEGNTLVKLGTSTERSFYLFEIDGKLYLNNYSGINEVVNGELVLKKELEAANRSIVFDNNLFVMSNIGLFRYPKEGGELGARHEVSTQFGGQSFGVEIYDNSIWFSVVNTGVVRVTKNNEDYNVEIFSNQHGLPNDASVELVKFSKKLYFGTNEGFFELNRNPSKDSSDLFIPKQFFEDQGEVSYPITDSRSNVWFVSSTKDAADKLASMRMTADKSYELEVDEYRLLNDQALTIIYPDPEEQDVVWVGGSRGLYRYSGSGDKPQRATFYTHIRSVAIKDSTIFYGIYKNKKGFKTLTQPIHVVYKLDNDQNNLKFEFGATSYEAPNLNQYSYFLEGFDSDWSGWSTDNKKEYTNVEAGKYTFKVKARDLYNNESSIASFSFSINNPWYYKPWAIVMFVFAALVLIRIIISIYTYRLRVTQHNLEELVENKTMEVLEKKKQIEEQNVQLINQTSQLESHRDEILGQKDQLEKKQLKIKSQNKKLKQLNLTKDKFFSIIGHDLKNPISSLISFSNLLTNHIDRMSKEEIRTMSIDFDKTLKNSYNLLDNLLEWSRSQTDQIEYNPVNFDIKELIAENKELMTAQAISKNINIDKGEVKSTIVYADKNCINTVIRNLISNALKFTPEGGKVTVSVTNTNEEVTVSVADNGVGMSKEVVNKLFTIDNKHATEGTAKEKGTGLGLVLCKEFVEINKGKIWLESELNKGSVFYFSLPAKK
ncbi:MAG: ATP-binding protein [Fulvivirga sp.]